MPMGLEHSGPRVNVIYYRSVIGSAMSDKLTKCIKVAFRMQRWIDLGESQKVHLQEMQLELDGPIFDPQFLFSSYLLISI